MYIDPTFIPPEMERLIRRKQMEKYGVDKSSEMEKTAKAKEQKKQEEKLKDKKEKKDE